MKVHELKVEPGANQGTARGQETIEESIRECGFGRGIVVDRDGRAICGSKVLEVAQAAGAKIRVVKSEGKKAVVVCRKDLNLETDQKAKQLAILDNRAGELNLFWDPTLLAEIGRELNLEELGLTAFTVQQREQLGGDPGDGKSRPKANGTIQIGNLRMVFEASRHDQWYEDLTKKVGMMPEAQAAEVKRRLKVNEA